MIAETEGVSKTTVNNLRQDIRKITQKWNFLNPANIFGNVFIDEKLIGKRQTKNKGRPNTAEQYWLIAVSSQTTGEISCYQTQNRSAKIQSVAVLDALGKHKFEKVNLTSDSWAGTTAVKFQDIPKCQVNFVLFLCNFKTTI